MLILNLMPAIHCKQIGTGATQDWEGCGKLKKHLFETWVTAVWIIVGDEMGIFESLSRSAARMGRGSPLCKTNDCVTTWAQEHVSQLL